MASRRASRERKKAFSSFALGCKLPLSCPPEWCCCSLSFSSLPDFQKHVSRHHKQEIDFKAQRHLQTPLMQDEKSDSDSDPEIEFSNVDEMKVSLTKHLAVWKSPVDGDTVSEDPERPVIVLFYKYANVKEPRRIAKWQRKLCEKLLLKGKIRIASEGINGTAGGTLTSIAHFVNAIVNHPLFLGMEVDDFKTSPDWGGSFLDGLQVSVCDEIVPLGRPTEDASYRNAGTKLTPKDFHERVSEFSEESGLSSGAVLLDCRNFYESRIGKFEGAHAPDIRKFSYFPDYVDKNEHFFKGKTVLMYCTGGIRCERASAYLKSKNFCKDVFQLSGGIHKYLEQYPQGLFRGKLYVFDERKVIKSNDDVISGCFFCGCPWDTYNHCTTFGCRQLVLSCAKCHSSGRTYCCDICHEGQLERKERCQCTTNRQQIPYEEGK